MIIIRDQTWSELEINMGDKCQVNCGIAVIKDIGHKYNLSTLMFLVTGSNSFKAVFHFLSHLSM